MTKEPTREDVLKEIKRRKRKDFGKYGDKNISYKSLLDLYVRRCKVRNLSEATIQGYMNASRYFMDFAGYDLMCIDIDQDLINEYYLYLQNFYKPQTINSYVFKVCPIVKFGIEEGYIKDDIIFTHVVEQKQVKEIYTKEELEKLLVRPQNGTFGEMRAWTVINTLISTGIRAGELRALKIKDVKIDERYIVLNQTKNREPRILPMPTTLQKVLLEWLEIRNGASEDYLFCNIYGEKLERSVLQSCVKKYSLKRGVKKYGLHLYRHTFITLSVKSGMSPVMLKRITGHKSMKMLEHYYQHNPTDLVDIVDQYNPLEKFSPRVRKF